MLRKIRLLLATVCFTLITLLFLDFTGTLHHWAGWLAKVQLVPAVLALHFGIVAALVVLTLIFGRLYCSVLCPMGVLQDLIAHLHRRLNRKHHYAYHKPLPWLRYAFVVIFVALLVGGVASLATLIAPYSAYGRIATHLFAPVYALGNNALAFLAERLDSYAFYPTEIWLKGGITLAVGAATLLVVGTLAWRYGRMYCNTICPVGTVLGLLSRFSWLKVGIDADKCIHCGACERICKGLCIDSKNAHIDYSRCVACGNCVGACHQGGLTYRHHSPSQQSTAAATADTSRRAFLAATGTLAATAAFAEATKKVDGGLAAIEDKVIPERQHPILPAGSKDAAHFHQHCTACQLCIAECPNGVLRPSDDLDTLMQPVMSYERGYCRPECTRCSEVCPTGAISLIDRAQKAGTKIGTARWIAQNCIINTDGVACGNCARHCPAGAITMRPVHPADPESKKVPMIDPERCLGCGACEYLCPARPLSAIVIDGICQHREV